MLEPAGDEELPDAEDLYATPHNPRTEEAIAALVDAGLLTERRAEVYVRRVLDVEPRASVAEDLGISESTLDDHRGAAKEQVAAARKTVAILDAYRSPELPRRCSNCNSTLGGSWTESDAGQPLCLECSEEDQRGVTDCEFCGVNPAVHRLPQDSFEDLAICDDCAVGRRDKVVEDVYAPGKRD